jgi:glycerophosphoryl diester phosphodiesterase
VDYAIRLNAYSLNLSFDQLTFELVSEAHHADIKVFVYTVNDAEDIQRCIALGVDAIYTDYPAKTIAILGTP